MITVCRTKSQGLSRWSQVPEQQDSGARSVVFLPHGLWPFPELEKVFLTSEPHSESPVPEAQTGPTSLQGEHKDKATFPHLLTPPWASNLDFNTRRFSHFIFWGDWKLPQAIWAVFMMVPHFGWAPKSELGREGLGAREFLGKVCPFPNTLPLCVQQSLTSMCKF